MGDSLGRFAIGMGGSGGDSGIVMRSSPSTATVGTAGLGSSTAIGGSAAVGGSATATGSSTLSSMVNVTSASSPTDDGVPVTSLMLSADESCFSSAINFFTRLGGGRQDRRRAFAENGVMSGDLSSWKIGQIFIIQKIKIQTSGVPFTTLRLFLVASVGVGGFIALEVQYERATVSQT